MIDSDDAVRDVPAGLQTRIEIKDDLHTAVAPYLSRLRQRKTAP